MKTIALATDAISLPNDFDMPLLLDACRSLGLATDICAWDDPTVDWSRYDHVVLRSTWDYTERLSEFIAWCEHIAAESNLVNPLPVVRWALDKHYLVDLASYGVPVVASTFIEPDTLPRAALQEFLILHPEFDEIVVKPTIGAYSKDVKRYLRTQESEAVEHIACLLGKGRSVILQPYLTSIDRDGETNLVYFDAVYSHAIRKAALLMQDGTVNVPTFDFRSPRIADEKDRHVAQAAISAATRHLALSRPLLYARIDLIRDNNGNPQILEMEICEPSLSLPLAEGSATRFAQVIADLPTLRNTLPRKPKALSPPLGDIHLSA